MRKREKGVQEKLKGARREEVSLALTREGGEGSQRGGKEGAHLQLIKDVKDIGGRGVGEGRELKTEECQKKCSDKSMEG